MILIHFSINSNQQEWRWKRHLNWSGIWLWMKLFVGKLRVLADNLPSVKQLVVCRRKRRKVGLCYRVFLLNRRGSDLRVCPSRCALFSTDISAGLVLLCLLFLLRKWQYAKFVCSETTHLLWEDSVMQHLCFAEATLTLATLCLLHIN